MQMEQRLNAVDASLHMDEHDDGEHHQSSIVKYLHAPHSDPAELVQEEVDAQHQTMLLQSALSSLDERSQDILKHRWLQEDGGLTLQDLADKYGVSAERIRQLEKNAMMKIKKHMVSNIACI